MKKLADVFLSAGFHKTLLATGLLLRIKRFLDNPSFWMDEAWYALDLSTGSFWDILKNKSLFIDMPIQAKGFALVEKGMVQLFGNHEMAFRLFPFFCGLASLFIFYKILKKFSTPLGLSVALAFFVFCDSQIRYSCELKHHACDLLMVLIVYLLAWNLEFNPLREKSPALRPGGTTDDLKTRWTYVFWGLLAIFFSYIAILGLIAITLPRMWSFIKRHQVRELKQLLFVCFVWVSGFMLFHGASILSMITQARVISGVNAFFVPYPVYSQKAVFWLFQNTSATLGELMGVVLPPLCLAIVFMGAVFVYRHDKKRFVVFMFPVFLAFAGAVVHKYPFGSRYLLFTIPAIIVAMTEVIAGMISSRRKSAALTGVFLALFLLWGPVKVSANHFIRPYVFQENREVVAYLQNQIQDKDVLYFNVQAFFGYGYYSGGHGYRNLKQDVVRIADHLVVRGGQKILLLRYSKIFYDKDGFVKILQNYEPIVERHAGSTEPFGRNERTWFLFSNASQELKDYVLTLLKTTGAVELNAVERKGVSLYLYDLSSKAL